MSREKHKVARHQDKEIKTFSDVNSTKMKKNGGETEGKSGTEIQGTQCLPGERLPATEKETAINRIIFLQGKLSVSECSQWSCC